MTEFRFTPSYLVSLAFLRREYVHSLIFFYQYLDCWDRASLKVHNYHWVKIQVWFKDNHRPFKITNSFWRDWMIDHKISTYLDKCNQMSVLIFQVICFYCFDNQIEIIGCWKGLFTLEFCVGMQPYRQNKRNQLCWKTAYTENVEVFIGKERRLLKGKTN